MKNAFVDFLRAADQHPRLVRSARAVRRFVSRDRHLGDALTTTAGLAADRAARPALTVIPHTDDSDAVRMANDSDYGLAGTGWTSDSGRGLAVARKVRTGTVGVNRYLPGPAAPDERTKPDRV